MIWEDQVRSKRRFPIPAQKPEKGEKEMSDFAEFNFWFKIPEEDKEIVQLVSQIKPVHEGMSVEDLVGNDTIYRSLIEFCSVRLEAGTAKWMVFSAYAQVPYPFDCFMVTTDIAEPPYQFTIQEDIGGGSYLELTIYP